MSSLKRFVPWVAGLLVVLSLALVSSFTMGQDYNAEVAQYCQSISHYAPDARTRALVQSSCMACERDGDGQACQVLSNLLGTIDRTF